MARSGASSRVLVALTALTVLVVGSATRAQTPAPQVAERFRERLRIIDSLAEASRIDTAIVLLEPVIREARRRGDRRTLATLVQTHATLIHRRGDDPQRQAREALDLATSLRDSSGMMAALALLGSRPLDHDGLVEPSVEWLLRLALSRDDYRFESNARTIMATDLLDQGQLEQARHGFTRAIELSRLAGDWRGELDAVSGLGHVHFANGDLDQAREAYRKVAKIAQDRHGELELGRALGNVAEIELVAGDLDAAVEAQRRAWVVFRRIGSTRDWMGPALQAASIQKHLALYADAESTLVHVAAACESLGQTGFRAQALVERADVLTRAGKPADAAVIARTGLGLGRALPLVERAGLNLALAEALGAQDSAVAGLALLDRELRTSRGRLPAGSRLELEVARAELLSATGRWREALDAYQRARRSAPPSPVWRPFQLVTAAGLAELALGRADRAAARLAEATRMWSADIDMPLDLEETERRDAGERGMRSLIVELAMSYPTGQVPGDRLRAAFDTLQHLRVRPLVERTLGPQRPLELRSRFELAPLTADSLQHAVLREDDLLLDLWLGSSASYLFALTRDSLRFVRLPRADELLRRTGSFGRLIAKGPSGVDPAAWDSSAARLGASLFADIGDLLSRSRRIVYVSDGELAALPLAALVLPNSSGAPTLLAASHAIERIPAASWLAAERATESPAGMGRILAMAGPSGESGAPSSRARGEVEDLRSRYQGVDVRTAERSPTTISPERLADYALLHLATPTRLDDHHPWHSGILLERPSGPERDPYWRVAAIGTSLLRARLVVLPACAPARGSGLSQAGVQALASALLAAGAEAVVVNLWPVDDASAGRWTEAFYARLAGGGTAAEAMASAQQAVRSDPATRAPHDWAGYALFGRGDVRVPLETRPRWWWPSIAGAGVVIAALALVIGARRRHTRERSIEVLA